MVQKAAKSFSTAYILLLFCVYPFYLENGYYNIGEAKMHFFLRVSLAAFIVLTILYLVISMRELKQRVQNRQTYLIDWEQVSVIDILVLLYATILFLSYVFSSNKEEALWGTEGWYMGLIPMLLLCALYFLISRLWMGGDKILYPVMAASAVVFLLGICNRFSFYPVTIEGAQPDFISTLGNINWFCGFLSVVASPGVGYFVVGQDFSLWKRVLFGVYAMITFAAGFAQGSDSIFLWFGAVFFLLLWIAAEQREYLKRWFVLLLLWAASAGTIGLLRQVTVDKYNYDTSGICGYFTSSYISLWIAAVAIIGYFCLCFSGAREEKSTDEIHSMKTGKAGRKLRIGLVVSVASVLIGWLVLSIINTASGLSFLQGNPLFTFDENWGHGRGVTVWAGVRTFWEQPLLQKIIGVGPDCFAAAAYEIPEIAFVLREHFGSARLTNAHNELLTTLVNNGIAGVVLYAGILLVCMVRCLKAGKNDRMLYVFALSILGYAVHNMVSFAQVLNMPFLFIVIGMAEAKKRRT